MSARVLFLERAFRKLLLSPVVFATSGRRELDVRVVSSWSWENSLARAKEEGSSEGISALTALGSSGIPTGEARISLLRWPGYLRA